ncbi:MAG: hypothetical protein BYD32DRAFT_151682 [Podila humilis]|nr:MAG: hypothetical protein BYD32DRAFT_151682 [Podila humilis]
MQQNNYAKIRDHDYQIASSILPGKTCCHSGCDMSISWRYIHLRTDGFGTLYLGRTDRCDRCESRAAYEKIEKSIRDHFGIEGDLVQGLINLLVPRHQIPAGMEDAHCARCLCKQDRSNSLLQLGRSIDTPLAFRSYCKECFNRHIRKAGILKKLSEWACKRNDERGGFASRDSALYTAMTVVVQGFSYGSATYSSSEKFHVRTMVEKATPVCFWTGKQLSLTDLTSFTTQFTVDRIMFDQEGKALRYGDNNQVLVAASWFANCFLGERTLDQRMQYLKKLDEEWDDGIEWADRAIFKLRAYDVEAEDERPWTAEWEQKWDRFLYQKRYNGKENRVKWAKSEWRFFVETCEHRSLVTGQCLEGNDAHIDRVFNSDNYTLQNCILIEGGLNFAKGPTPEFQNSESFDGPCKMTYGVSELRGTVKEMLKMSRESWSADIDGMKTNPYPWKDKIPPYDRYY